jgi:hypothetical protein
MQLRAGSLAFVLVFSLAYSTAGDASYIIKLKNGNEIVTSRYWQEGQQVMFDTYGGVFGVDRAYVIKIEESNKSVKQQVEPEPTLAKIPAPPAKEEKEQGHSPRTEVKSRTARENDPIFKDFDTLKQRSQTVAGMWNSELQEFLKELTALRRRIQASGRSNDYLREFTEISEMGDAAEALLTKRQ